MMNGVINDGFYVNEVNIGVADRRQTYGQVDRYGSPFYKELG